MRKKLKTAAAVLTAAGFLLFAAAFISSGFDFSKLSGVKYETSTYTEDTAFRNIRIDSEEADIELRQSTDATVSVVCCEKEKVKHSVRVSDDTLMITAHDERAWYDYLMFPVGRAKITVYLPDTVYRSLIINGAAGDIDLSDFTFGSIEIAVSTGDIRIRNVQCTGDIVLKASTGDSELAGVMCKSLHSESSTGDVRLNNVVASEFFTIKASTGDVKFDRCDASRIDISTSTGDVTGTLLSEFIFMPRTSTGSINVPDTVSGGRCEITTSTGDISVRIAHD